MNHIRPILSPIFLIFYIFFTYFLLLKIFSAILNEAFSAVKDSKKVPSETDLNGSFKKFCIGYQLKVDRIKRKFKKFWAKCKKDYS